MEISVKNLDFLLYRVERIQTFLKGPHASFFKEKKT